MPESYDHSVVNGAIADAVARPGWTQARLAKALGIRPQTVNKWVQGENTPPPARWRAIENALDLDEGTFHRLVFGSNGGLPQPHSRMEHTLELSALSGKIDQLSSEDRRYVEELVDRLLGAE